MTSPREKGLAVAAEMLTPAGAAMLDGASKSGLFGGDIAELVLENVFGGLWAREGLDRRSRSLLTLGILIAEGAHDELATHAAVALRNGLTERELEEVVYHATAYAGFPKASAARGVMQSALTKFKENGE